MQRFFDYVLVERLEEIAIGGRDGRPSVVSCLNPHSFVTALGDEDFRSALVSSDWLLPDGEGVCLAMRRWKGVDIRKIAGDDLHSHLLRRLDATGGRIYYMGSSDKVLRLIGERMHKEHPAIAVRSLSPSYCDELPEAESLRIVADINAFAPDVLLVSMTAPKQEKWVAKYRDSLTGVGLVASVGAVFEFYAGTVKRAPRWAVGLKLEWLVRLLKEPRRMWSRTFVSTPAFLRWVRRHRQEI